MSQYKQGDYLKVAFIQKENDDLLASDLSIKDMNVAIMEEGGFLDSPLSFKTWQVNI